MMYYPAVIKHAEELGLKVHQCRYEDHLYRADVHEVTLYEERPTNACVIAKIRLIAGYELDSMLSVNRAAKALNDYASWK